LPSAEDIVEGLRKISVTVEAGTTAERMDLEIRPGSAEFIFGIATEGLTPLEARLAGKRVGETVAFSLEPRRISTVAGHLCRHLPKLPDKEEPVFLRIRIEDIRPADNREVVRAMAEMSACGEGCCGGH